MTEAGVLYVVATPIGNLQDLSSRALAVLNQVSEIAAEDTRHSMKLLRHFGVKTHCVSLHEHNEVRVVPSMVEKLVQGRHVALISDAGTPLISDPGYLLVQGAIEAGIQVVSVPGPCALIAALSISGLAADRFIYEGFLSAKSGPRMQRLSELQSETRTLIFYESCHRLIDSISDMRHAFGGSRKAVIVREITKMFEHVERGRLDALCKLIADDVRFHKGEYVVLVEGYRTDDETDWQQALKILTILMKDLRVSQAAKLASEITGMSKKRLYQYALEHERSGGADSA